MTRPGTVRTPRETVVGTGIDTEADTEADTDIDTDIDTEADTEAEAGTEHVDALVVGSGFGGSVAAFRLAEAGLRTVVLERGRAYPPGSFPRSPREVSRALWDPSAGLHGMFQMWRFAGFDSLTSAGLGGGSLIYANVLLRKDEKWFVQDDPLPGGGYETWPVTRADLDPHYDRVERTLGGTPYPFGEPGYSDTAKTGEMIAAAEKLGLNWELPPLAVSFSPRPGEQPGLGLPIPLPEYGSIHGLRYGTARRTCRLLGECDLGCNEGAKNSLDHTYLSAAVHAGAEVRVLSEAVAIRPEERGNRRGYLVDYVRHDPQRAARTRELTPRRIHCDHLVLGAGTYGTSWLLLRNRERLPGIGDPLGTRFSGNGDLLTFLLPAVRGRRLELDASRGPVITMAVRVPDRLDGDGADPGAGTGRGHYVEDGGYPGFVDWMVEETDVTGRIFRFGEFLTRWAAERVTGPSGSRVGREISRLIGDGSLSGGALPLLGMGRDVPDGTFLLDRSDRPDLAERLQATWRTDTSREYFAAVRRTMRRFAETLGTDYLDNPIWFFRRVISVHPLGGAPMGRTPEEGVCDPYGEVWNHPGLWIADGSAMPGAVGANPSLTIAAWADRLADRLLETRNRPAAAAPARRGTARTRAPKGRPARERAEPQASASLSFTEEMKGFFALDEADPPTGDRLGRAAHRRLSFHVTITADDLDRFLAEPEHRARAEGWVEADDLGGRLPLSSGSFNLFTQGEDPTTRHLSYLLHFTDRDGAPLTLSGRKEVRHGPAADIWPDTSTLYFRLLSGHLPEGRPEGDAPIRGAGVLHILKPDFVRELAGLRVRGPRATAAAEHFTEFFLGELWEVYGPALERVVEET